MCGVGSRIGSYTKAVNKALVSLGDLPAIVRIILQFDQRPELVIPLGYKGDHIKQVIDVFFPERKITYVEIDKYEGPGSGLGYTLSKVRSHLQCPFIFCSNDSLVELPSSDMSPIINGNWIGTYKKITGDEVPSDQYRTVSVADSLMANINPKGVENKNIYTGICGIQDYMTFWKSMDLSKDLEIGESCGIMALNQVRVIEIKKWWDTGNLKSIQKAKKFFKSKDKNILEKEEEAIWFYKESVIKFHTSPDFIKDRIKRSNFLSKEILPKITNIKKNLFVYRKVTGEVLSNVINSQITTELLEYTNNLLWSKSREYCKKDSDHLEKFYKIKTIDRINYYLKRFEKKDKALCINSIECSPVKSILEKVNWVEFYKTSIISNFHGDFHSENILFEENSFKFLDWRQDFGGMGYQYGDCYYDLAKFKHGLLVAHNIVNQNQFNVNYKSPSVVNIDINIRLNNSDALKIFEDWCMEKNFCIERIDFVTSLIFLNICGLHEYPYSEFLFLLGTKLLNQLNLKNSKYLYE